MIDVDQANGGLGLLLLALLERDLQQVFPGTVVEQPGQAVGTAQGTEGAFVLGQFDRQLITDHANRQGVERQHRQASVDLKLTDRRREGRTEQQP
ncbi:hypothetical protein D3C80_1056880 [compost metagenome]